MTVTTAELWSGSFWSRAWTPEGVARWMFRPGLRLDRYDGWAAMNAGLWLDWYERRRVDGFLKKWHSFVVWQYAYGRVY